jgi:hypothetical protein
MVRFSPSFFIFSFVFLNSGRAVDLLLGFILPSTLIAVMMIDPAISYQPGDKGVFDRGTKADVFLKEKDGKLFQGVVWAGKVIVLQQPSVNPLS